MNKHTKTELPEGFLDAMDDLSNARDLVELLLLAHKHHSGEDVEAKAVARGAFEVILHLDAATAKLDLIREGGATE